MTTLEEQVAEIAAARFACAGEDHADPLRAYACPEPGCRMPVELIDRFSIGSSDGPVDHVKIRCPSGHWFAGPVDLLLGGAD